MTLTNVRPEVQEAGADSAVTPPDRRPNPVGSGVLLIAAAASLAAGATHAAAVAAHSEHRQAVWAFVSVAVAQLVWGAIALVHNDRRLAVVGGLIGVAALGGWVLATTTGVQFVEGLEEPQEARLVDQFAAGLAAVTVVACVVCLATRRIRLPRSAAIAAAVALIAVGVPSAAAAVNHGHGPPAVPAAVPPKGFTPGLPIDLSGVPGVSLQQQARAEALLARTVERLPKWADPAFAEANGFRSIRDGSTGVEHYLNRAFIEDDVMLDPDQPESLVYDTTVSPKKLVAAMYMATPGTTLDTVPDIGGALTQWHIHNNLCFNGQGQFAGLTQSDGSCRAPLVKGEELPMIHAWIESRPCGPFSALEGIGAGQVKPGDTKACNAIHG